MLRLASGLPFWFPDECSLTICLLGCVLQCVSGFPSGFLSLSLSLCLRLRTLWFQLFVVCTPASLFGP